MAQKKLTAKQRIIIDKLNRVIKMAEQEEIFFFYDKDSCSITAVNLQGMEWEIEGTEEMDFENGLDLSIGHIFDYSYCEDKLYVHPV